jgi:hypothetical protein
MAVDWRGYVRVIRAGSLWEKKERSETVWDVDTGEREVRNKIRAQVMTID